MIFVNTQIALIVLASYLLGSIPFGFLMARKQKIDIRKHGSGNIGATNVLRTLGPKFAATVFSLDMFKGTVAIYLARYFTDNAWLIILAGLAAVLGHTFPIFLKFKGGRGAATGLGILLGIAPDIFFFAFTLVVIIVAATRYVSVASMVTPLAVTVALWLLNRPVAYTTFAGAVSILIILRHIPNIKRLLRGKEPKIGKK